jgi:hypothetical protein
MRKGDFRAFFTLNRIEKSGKTLDTASKSDILELKPIECSRARWLAILKQTKAAQNEPY